MTRFSMFGVIVVAAALLSGMGCGRSPSPLPLATVRTLTAEEIRGLVATGTNRVTLLHVWATWCPPCVKEFPDVVRLARAHRGDGLQVLLVSADAETNLPAVTRFLADHGVDWQAYLAVNVNDAFIKTISPQWSGALPASFYYSADGTLVESWEGARPYDTHEEVMLRVVKEQHKQGEGR